MFFLGSGTFSYASKALSHIVSLQKFLEAYKIKELPTDMQHIYDWSTRETRHRPALEAYRIKGFADRPVIGRRVAPSPALP